MSDRCGIVPGVCGCLAAVGRGDASDALPLRLEAGPVGGALSAAGPRGGDLIEGVLESWGTDPGASRTDADPDVAAGWGVSSRDARGERTRVDEGRGDARSEVGRETRADETPESRGGEDRLYPSYLSLRRFGGLRDLGLYEPPRAAIGVLFPGGLLSRRSRPKGDRDRLLSSRLSSRLSKFRSLSRLRSRSQSRLRSRD